MAPIEQLNQSNTSKTVLCTKENGILRLIKGMDVVYKFGPTDPGMMDFGKTAWQADTDVWSMLRAMFTKAPGMKTRQMVSEFTPTIMEAGTRANGSTTSSMERESRNGRTALSTLENTWKV